MGGVYQHAGAGGLWWRRVGATGPKRRAWAGAARSLLEMQGELSGQLRPPGAQALILKCHCCLAKLSGELLAPKE